MRQPSDHFPVLNIREFSENRSQGCNLLFHELHGERSIDKPHKHDFFVIILFERGKGIHTIDFLEHRIEKHQVHLLFPGQVHGWKIAKGTIGYQLMISREWFEAFLPSLRFSPAWYQNHPVIGVPEEIHQSLLYEFRAIQNELAKKSIFWELIQARSKLVGLLISSAVENAFSDIDMYHANPVVAKFILLIDQHFKKEHSVSFYADKLHISANYLNIVCRKNLRVSASSLIRDRILLEAKRLLKVSGMPVKDIVYELGFYDHASFSKFFKTQTEMAPSQFKEQG